MNIQEANAYFDTSVLHNYEWINADEDTRLRALNNAKNILYRAYRRFNESRNPLPDEVIYEQALWLLRMDDTIRKSEQGVTSIMVDGIQISITKIDKNISPQVISLLGRRVGKSTSGRKGYWV